TRDRRSFHLDLFKVPKAVDTIARQAHLLRIEPGAFELAHFAPDDVIACVGIAGYVDAPDVYAPPRVDDECESHFAFFAIRFRYRVGGRECVTEHAQSIGDALGYAVQALRVVDIARLHVDQCPKLL